MALLQINRSYSVNLSPASAQQKTCSHNLSVGCSFWSSDKSASQMWPSKSTRGMLARELRFQTISQHLQHKFKGPGFCLVGGWSEKRRPDAGGSKVWGMSPPPPPECLVLCWRKASRCSGQGHRVRPDSVAGGGLQTFSGHPSAARPSPEETYFKA